jgi:hypothetical protein
MGFDLQTTRFVLAAKESGIDFSRSITLGRQNLQLDRETYARESKRFGLETSQASLTRVFGDLPFVDGMLRELGAEAPSALDASSYEEADVIADLNLKIPNELFGRFSLGIDGGTLEHVFDFPQAVRNVASLLQVGGHFLSINGAKYFVGHGF